MSAFRIALHALIRSGLTAEEIAEHSTAIFQDLLESNEIQLLSLNILRLLKDDNLIK